MSISIKLLVELNNEKYTVFVESDYKYAKFKTVSDEIITQLKKNISFKTHLFELFDQDFNEYVLVTNENQMVENLSRIRVKSKESTNVLNNIKDGGGDCVSSVAERLDQLSVADKSLSKTPSDMTNNELSQFCNYLFGNNSKNLIENNSDNKSVTKAQPVVSSSAKALDEFIENNLSEKTKDLAKHFFNLSDSSADKLINKELNVEKVEIAEDLSSGSTDDTVVEASNHQTIRNDCQTSPQPPEEAANYLDLQLSNNYRLSPSCPHLYHKTFVEKFRRRLVVTIRIRYEDFKAIQTLLELLDINRRSFEKNRSNDDPTNPKWKTISDQMISNGFDDWTAKQCKDGFTNALDLYKKSLDRCPDYDTAAKVNPLFTECHTFDLKYIISLSEFIVIRDLRDLFGRKLSKFSQQSNSSLRKYSSNVSMVDKNQLEDKNGAKQKDLVFRNSAKMGSNMSLQSMSNGFDNRAKNRSQIDRMKLKRVGQKVDNLTILSFKALAKCVATISAQFGHVSHNTHYWELVSNQMKANGYKAFSPHDCYRMFTEHVCDYYSLALTYCSDVRNAQEVYPLFEFIYSMDLSLCLSNYSYHKIKDLRKAFEQKSDFFKQMFAK